MERWKKFGSATALLVAVAMSTGRAGAQVFDTTQMINDHVRMQNLIVTDMLIRNSMTGKGSAVNPVGSRRYRLALPGVGGTRTVPSDVVTFRPVTDNIMPEQLARAVFKEPDERAKMERFLGEMLASYKGLLSRRGLPPNDVSRAASYLISQAYFVHNDGRYLTAEQFAALVAQMRDMFARDEGFSRRTDREKQELYESFAIQGELLGVGYLATKQTGDAKTLFEVRQRGRRVLEGLFGARAEDIRFTAEGVAYR